MSEFSKELKIAVNAAIKAGKSTLTFYNNDLEIQLKPDYSPLTLADLESNAIIESELKKTEIPILSEESQQIEYSERKNWEKYWLVDPLDGTKEFIKKSEEYTVNIALMKNDYPVMGVIYLPAKDILYFGCQNVGAYKLINAANRKDNELFLEKNWQKLPLTATNSFTIVASRSHLDENTKAFINSAERIYHPITIENYGSSLKFCMIAEGRADVYPRMAPTMEWDIAAGHAIVEAAGCCLVKYPSFKPIDYNKEDLRNPWFIAFNQKYTTKTTIE
jgi:3'(2'), 5'-bisphosphate nucleotidase